jgi:hypothetical protein
MDKDPTQASEKAAEESIKTLALHPNLKNMETIQKRQME